MERLYYKAINFDLDTRLLNQYHPSKDYHKAYYDMRRFFKKHGKLPIKQYRILLGWMSIHEDELYAAWNNAVRSLPFDRIEPLQ